MQNGNVTHNCSINVTYIMSYFLNSLTAVKLCDGPMNKYALHYLSIIYHAYKCTAVRNET